MKKKEAFPRANSIRQPAAAVSSAISGSVSFFLSLSEKLRRREKKRMRCTMGREALKPGGHGTLQRRARAPLNRAREIYILHMAGSATGVLRI